jgi:Arc/MetJ-type ribon-helix-helix transcriptional regulator
MMAQSGKPQTFSDVIEALVSRSVLLPPEMIRHVEEFIEANKQLGYTTREEFVREAVNETLRQLSGKCVKEPEEMEKRKHFLCLSKWCALILTRKKQIFKMHACDYKQVYWHCERMNFEEKFV